MLRDPEMLKVDAGAKVFSIATASVISALLIQNANLLEPIHRAPK
jgi:hypothetical protein